MPTKLRHVGAIDELELEGVAGDVLTLQGDGEQYLEWNPKGKPAIDVEIRAFVAAASPQNLGLGTTPLVRYRYELGHGDRNYNIPQTAMPIVSGNPSVGAILPGRGLVLRLSTRYLRIFFSGPLTLAGLDQTGIKIAVSVQPVRTQLVPQRTQFQRGTGSGFSVFPPEASEFRVRQPLNAQPWGAGACSIEFVSLFGQLLSIQDVSAGGFNNFQPIPVFAARMVCNHDIQIDYQ